MEVNNLGNSNYSILKELDGIEKVISTLGKGEDFNPDKDNIFYAHTNKLLKYSLEHLGFVKNNVPGALEAEKDYLVERLSELYKTLEKKEERENRVVGRCKLDHYRYHLDTIIKTLNEI